MTGDHTVFTESAALLAEAERYIVGGVNSRRRRTTPPISAARAFGAYLWDVDGRRYIDYSAAAGPIILGYSYPPVTQRVAETIRDRVLFCIGSTELEVELARKIVHHVPSVDQILMCNTGTEAVQYAIRLARAVTKRTKLIKFQGCYHGIGDYVLMNNQSHADRIYSRDPGSAGMLDALVDETLICRFNDLESVAETMRLNPDRVAAVIVEPIAHNAPGILPKPGFLEGLRHLCDENGALLIWDEIITGFRHALGGYQTIAGIDPDLTTFGKAMANGFPIAVVGGKQRYMERFSTNLLGDVAFAGTFNGSQVSVAAALATIQCLEDGKVYEHIFRLGDRMRTGLQQIGRRLGVPAFAAGYGSIFALLFMEGPLETYEDSLRNDAALFERYRREMIARGCLEIPDSRSTRSHISYSHTDEDIDRTLEAAEESLKVAVEHAGVAN